MEATHHLPAPEEPSSDPAAAEQAGAQLEVPALAGSRSRAEVSLARVGFWHGWALRLLPSAFLPGILVLFLEIEVEVMLVSACLSTMRSFHGAGRDARPRRARRRSFSHHIFAGCF